MTNPPRRFDLRALAPLRALGSGGGLRLHPAAARPLPGLFPAALQDRIAVADNPARPRLQKTFGT